MPSESPKKAHRKKELPPVDEEREIKRRKIIEEFYVTERTYVEGLDLIYMVRPPLQSSKTTIFLA